MSEMVEWVARAMFAASEPASDWDDEGGRHQEQWRTEARAAILAMREPTDRMVRAGRIPAPVRHEEAAMVYRAMIDEALR